MTAPLGRSAPEGARVAHLSITPVKGTALHHPDAVELRRSGAVGDRAFFFVSDDDKLFSITRTGAFAGVRAEFGEVFSLFDGNELLCRGPVQPTDPIEARSTARRSSRGESCPALGRPRSRRAPAAPYAWSRQTPHPAASMSPPSRCSARPRSLDSRSRSASPSIPAASACSSISTPTSPTSRTGGTAHDSSARRSSYWSAALCHAAPASPGTPTAATATCRSSRDQGLPRDARSRPRPRRPFRRLRASPPRGTLRAGELLKLIP